ncbi:MAG: hypothetical protein WCJ58_07910 [bacterium]
MLPTLTKRQREILEYIRIFRELNGYSPSLIDIKTQFKLSAVSTVHEHIQNLQQKGYLLKEINQARSIKPLENHVGKNNFIEIPIRGNFQVNEITACENKDLIVVPKRLFHEFGETFILINKNVVIGPDIKENDLLVFLIKNSYLPADLVLAETPTKKFILGTKKKKGAQIFFTDYITNNNYSKFQILGKLILQFRQYLP